MSIEYIDAACLAKMFVIGSRNLESQKDYINELNVFPVPDGDTGTNMTMTALSAAGEVLALKDPDFASISDNYERIEERNIEQMTQSQEGLTNDGEEIKL